MADFLAKIHEVGSGPTLVLVHGSASDARTWEGQVGPLSEHFRVLTYSRRFHWPNEPPTELTNYKMSDHVNDLVGVIESAGADPVHLIGHSYGGFVALLTSLRHPEMVRSQVLIEPPVVPLFLSDSPTPPELLRVLRRKPALGLALLKFGARGLVPATKAAQNNDMDRAIRLFGKAVLGAESFDRLGPERWAQVEANNLRAEYLSESFDPLTNANLHEIRTPTLLVSGTESPKLWPLLADHLDDHLAASRRVEISGASHIVHEDNAADFNRAALEFLRNLA